MRTEQDEGVEQDKANEKNERDTEDTLMCIKLNTLHCTVYTKYVHKDVNFSSDSSRLTFFHFSTI